MNQLSLLLLVDPDRRGLETLTYGFEREGCAVAGTSDPALAPELARTTTPQLAVISLHGSDHAALNLIAGLRGQPGTQDLPVVTLGPEAMRPAALAAGASDFLSTPLYVRDVISVGRLMLTLRNAIATGGGETELQGRLSEYRGLYYLLRAMAATNRSGILQLSRGNKKGEVRFSEGTPTSAHVGSLQAFPALHHLLLWEESALSLKLHSVVRRSQFSLSAADLLEECERFMRDFAHAARDLGTPRTVYLPTSAAPLPGAKKVPSEATPVLRLFDGRRTLSEVIEESPFRIFDTLRVVKRLLDAGGLILQPGSVIRDEAVERMDQWLQRSATPAPEMAVPAHADRSVKVAAPPSVAAPPPRPSGAHQPLSASRPTPARLSSIPDQRTTTGERRKSARHRDLSAPEPAARKTPAPIPLTVRKTGSQAAPSAEAIHAHRQRQHTPPPAAALAIGHEPTIHMKLDAAFPPRATAPVTNEPTPFSAQVTPALESLPPVSAQASAGMPSNLDDSVTGFAGPARHLTPAPVAVAPASKGPDSKGKLKKISHSRLTPTSAFDAIESDFFAREADLYKRDNVESFDDLDRGGTARKLQPVRNAVNTARKKR